MSSESDPYAAIHQAQAEGNPILADALCEQLIAHRPDDHRAWYLRGSIAHREAHYDLAISYFQAAVRLSPDTARYHNNLGSTCRALNRLPEAEACYQRALALQPDYPLAQINLAVTWLMAGDYARGWPAYEWRWRQPGTPQADFAEPVWDGSVARDRTLLVHAEQGLGDTIQFVRLLPQARQRVGSLVLVCAPALVPMLEQFPGADAVVARGAALPRCDLRIPLLTLPAALGITLENLPHDTPYLFAHTDLVARWRARLRRPGKHLVAIAWQGNPQQVRDRWRSVKLTHFAPLLANDRVQFVSLQKALGREQIASLADPSRVIDLGEELDRDAPFLDTAAIMTVADLVITTDTAVAHLAGALHRPTWLALAYEPDFRWLRDRSDSPWYPSLTLFRQSEPRNWPEVFSRLASDLATFTQINPPAT